MDHSKTNTLPDPELNPLLNPLLASHMGRWAEVYFTTPPEKRDQAVAELIRELQNDSSVEPPSVEVASVAENDKEEVSSSIPTGLNEEEPSSNIQSGLHAEESFPSDLQNRCGACGHQNSENQLFCGMCGTPLQLSGEAHMETTQESVAEGDVSSNDSDEFALNQHAPETDFASEPEPPFAADLHGNEDEPAGDAHFHDRTRDENSRRSVAWAEIDLPGFALEPEPVPYRYRLYVGVALTILLTLLVYMAWRGTKAISGTSGTQSVPARVIPPAPVESVQPASQPSRAQSSSAQSSSAQSSPAHPSQGQPSPKTAANSARAQGPERASPGKKQAQTALPQALNRPSTNAARVTRIPPPVATGQSGAEEFATAEGFLNGTQAGSRNPREASVWLWKAVGKGNAAATMTLSDLYLRGDGVPKNCDQARLLLNVAARKGLKGAGERLRNLRAFGCE